MATPTGLSPGLTETSESQSGTTASEYGTATSSGYGAASSKEQRTMERVVQSAHHAVDRLAERASPAVARVKSGYAGATEALHERAEQLGHLQEQVTENARGKVRAHPLAAVGVALALGLLIGRIIR